MSPDLPATTLQEYAGGKPCPKCGHARAAGAPNPDWQCPGCGIAYLKYRRPAGAAAVSAGRELVRDARLDCSAWALIAANLVAGALALAQDVTLGEMMTVYWLQSVMIGLSFFVRMQKLRRFTTEGLKMNDEPVPETEAAKQGVALFFLFHYGLFHLCYLIFLVSAPARDAGAALDGGLWLCVLSLAAGHAYSLAENLQLDSQGTPNLGVLMLLPYARILPMHLTIVFGALVVGGGVFLAVFILLKTAADVIMHLVEHRVLRGAALEPVTE